MAGRNGHPVPATPEVLWGILREAAESRIETERALERLGEGPGRLGHGGTVYRLSGDRRERQASPWLPELRLGLTLWDGVLEAVIAVATPRLPARYAI